MSYSETFAGAVVVIDVAANGALRAANIERRYAATFSGSPLPDRLDRAVLTGTDLAAVLPDQATLTARVLELEAERSALIAERDALAARVPTAEIVNGVPQEVSAYQARAALLSAGLLDAVEAAVAVADRQVRIAWEYATTVRRTSPFIAAMQGALGLDDAAVDALFIAAAAIE